MSTVTEDATEFLVVAGSTEQKVSFQIRPNLLKAMAILASTDETRDVLRCVYLDYFSDIPLLVSTDGHRMGIYNLKAYENDNLAPAKGGTFMIPASLIRQVPVESRGKDMMVTITFSTSSVCLEYRKSGKDVSCASSLVEGCYPRWRNVIPDKPTAKLDVLLANADYVNDFQKVGKLISGQNVVYPVLVGGKDLASPINVYLDGVPEFYGILMPVRLNSGKKTHSEFKQPDWIL